MRAGVLQLSHTGPLLWRVSRAALRHSKAGVSGTLTGLALAALRGSNLNAEFSALRYVLDVVLNNRVAVTSDSLLHICITPSFEVMTTTVSGSFEKKR